MESNVSSKASSVVLAIVLVLCAPGCMAMMSGRASYEPNDGVLKLSPVVLYQNSTGPASYHSPVGNDAGKAVTPTRVTGEACQSGIYIPILGVGWGQGGFAEAIEAAGLKVPGRMLYDIQADLKTTMILSIWRRQCVVVNAAVVDL
jgi:hypothetical protein